MSGVAGDESPGATSKTPISVRVRMLAIGFVDGAPRSFERLLAKSALATAVISLVIAFLVRPHGTLPGRQEVIVAGALFAICVVCAAYIASISGVGGLARFAGKRVLDNTRAGIAFALAVWFPLLLIPVYLCARSTEPPSQTWLGFGFMDKRWETSMYMLGTLAPMLLLLGASRLIDVGRAHPESWRRWAQDTFSGAVTAAVPRPDVRFRVVAVRALAIAIAVAGAWYLYGPPWYLEHYTGGVGYHEDLHLSGLQAMHDGDLPYVGPAANQYGPGAQLLMYEYMTRIGPFSIIGVRDSFALFHWLAVSIFFVVLVLALGVARAAVCALLSALVYPTLQMFGFASGDVYTGQWGWGDLLRYAGAFAFILLLPGVVRRLPSRRGVAAGLALGLLWGFLSYVAQENLADGAIGACVVSLLLLLSRTASFRAVVQAAATVFAGFLVTWIPVALFYLRHGALGQFIHLYLLVPRLVAEGYSNASYLGGFHSLWGRMFYLFPFVLCALALISVLRFRPLRIARDGWSNDRLLLVATLVTTVVIYEGALLRSDSTHLIGTMLAVPVLGIVAVTTVPHVVGARRLVSVVVCAAIAAAPFYFLPPRSIFQWAFAKQQLVLPYHDRRVLAHESTPATPTTVAGRRIGAGLAQVALCCSASNVTMPAFIRFMDRIHGIVGDRTAYVADFRDGYAGLVYFAADLRPAPTSVDLATMVVTATELTAYNNDFESRVLPKTQALLGMELTSTYARDFLAAYPHSRTVILRYRGKPYYVLLRR
jgi:hypothetical protein